MLSDFKNEIMGWFKKNNINTISEIRFSDYSGYDIDNHILYIGVETANEADWFEEFLIDKGLEWEDIPAPVLQLLHEVGHSYTIYDYTPLQLVMFEIMKPESTEDSKKNAFAYWNVEDELAANNWLIDFINNNNEAFLDLCFFFINNWEDNIEDMLKEEQIL